MVCIKHICRFRLETEETHDILLTVVNFWINVRTPALLSAKQWCLV